MARYYDAIGYRDTGEDPDRPGIWNTGITEHFYEGDVLRDIFRSSGSSKVNDDVTISNQISIIADPYAFNNCHSIVYATYMGAKWKVSSVEPKYPRLILTLGGLYND